jgi:tetratricopeptide (TPR) repeat protein
VKRWIGYWLLALALVACRSPLRPAIQSPAPVAPVPASVEGLAAAIASDAQRSDRETDSRIRIALAADAGRDAEACMAQEPRNVACLYGRAIALGLDGRAHPTRAGELLRSMLERLSDAEAADAGYDHAGPARVRALVLIRAPGWPLGPGDPEAGLAAARRAAALRPEYPPNHLALAEALAKTGDLDGARKSYELARDLAQALPSATDRDGWLREADQALGR